jgi:nanoRNase/pAp phosphatase (c-di-AMP/oligoRNAs hydrolase)
VKIVSELCKKGASLRESRDFLILPKNNSEILSYIKAVKRLKAYQVKNSIMIFTRINSYQASIANILLDLGADISLALGEKQDGTRGSLRSTQSFYKETNLHLGMDVAYMASSKLGGHGGGHPKAASFTVPISVEKTMENIIHIIQTKLGVIIKEINS